MTKNWVITGDQALNLKPYLKYMDFGEVRLDRRHLVENMMFQNMMMGNIKISFIDDLRINYMKAHPGAILPNVFRNDVQQ